MLRNIGNYIKDFLDRCIYYYKNDETYRKSTKNILLFFIIVNFIFLLINYFNAERLKELFKINEIGYITISITICIARLFVQIVYSFLTIPTDYIQPDMDKLPSKIGKYPVAIQYDPPKGLNPSEVGLLYNQSYESTNIDCMLYKWEYEGLIEIEDKGNGTVVVFRNKEIDNKVPSYERQYRTMVFGFDRKDRVVRKRGQTKQDIKEIIDLHSELSKYCVEKGWLKLERINYSGIFPMIFCILLIPIFPVIGIVVILYLYAVVVSHSFGSTYLGNKIRITDEGESLLAHIVGFKYWLEHCEEQQIKKILKDDPSFNSKILPYIIALRMDWKLLDKKFYK